MYRKFKPATTKVANPRKRKGAKSRRRNGAHAAKHAHNPTHNPGRGRFRMRRRRRNPAASGGAMGGYNQKQMVELALYAAGAGVSTAAVTAIVQKLMPAEWGIDPTKKDDTATRTAYAAAGSAVIGGALAFGFRKKRNVAKFFAIHGIISAGYALISATKSKVDEQVEKLFAKEAKTDGMYLANTGLLSRDMSGLVIGQGATGILGADLKPAKRAMF